MNFLETRLRYSQVAVLVVPFVEEEPPNDAEALTRGNDTHNGHSGIIANVPDMAVLRGNDTLTMAHPVANSSYQTCQTYQRPRSLQQEEAGLALMQRNKSKEGRTNKVEGDIRDAAWSPQTNLAQGEGE